MHIFSPHCIHFVLHFNAYVLFVCMISYSVTISLNILDVLHAGVAVDDCLVHRFCAKCMYLEHPFPSDLQELMLQIESCDTIPYHIRQAAEGLEGELYLSMRSLLSQFLILHSIYTHVKPINSNYWPTPGSLFLLALLFHPPHHAKTKRSSKMCQESGHYCLLAQGD